jgi:hypothetical protein
MSQCAKGFWPHGRVSFGYEAVKVEGGFKLMVTERTRADFDVVKRIFREAAEGRDGSNRIAERLTRDGVNPPATMGRPRNVAAGIWMAPHVGYILTNPIYCGHIVEKGEVMYRNSHEAAVDDETFARIQARRSLRNTKRKNGEGNGSDPVKSGFRGTLKPWLRCGTCGGNLSVAAGGKVGARTYIYYCTARMQNKTACPGISVRVDKVDEIVMEAIERKVLAPENVKVMLHDTLIALASTDMDQTDAERQRLTEQIAELDRKIRLTAIQVINGLIDEGDAKVISAPLMQQRETARFHLLALPTQRQTLSADDVDPEAFRDAILKQWRDKPVDEQREALSKVLDRVTLHPGGIHIAYSLGGYCEHGMEGPFNRI